VVKLKEDIMDYDSFVELIKNRRSSRSFKKDPVPDSSVRKIVESVWWAPSGMNSQPWEVVVVRKQALKDGIAGLVSEEVRRIMSTMPPRPMPPLKPGQKPPSPTDFADAPVFILLFGDTRVRNFGPPMGDNTWIALFAANLTLGFHNMLLAASTLGLGAQWISMVANPDLAPKINKLLGVPDCMKLFAMIALGYPDMEPMPKKMRSLDKMIHFDECAEADFRTLDEVKAFCLP
jgi:nitroreductase